MMIDNKSKYEYAEYTLCRTKCRRRKKGLANTYHRRKKTTTTRL